LLGLGDEVLVLFATLLLAGIIGLLFIPKFGPAVARWRYSSWIAKFVVAARRVLLGPRSVVILGVGCFIHALAILAICSLGRAQGLSLRPLDLAVLFSVMVGLALVPITVSGWGLRELAIVVLLGNYGVAPERALMFSVSFGLALFVAALPGALAWLLYSVSPLRLASGQADER
jgi:hypothetical protein